jgi:hypothetical protein
MLRRSSPAVGNAHRRRSGGGEMLRFQMLPEVAHLEVEEDGLRLPRRRG